MINQAYEQIYYESVRFKDWGCLLSSLRKREEATRSVEGDAGYYAIGKANEATLLGHHIGDGLSAYKATIEALKDIGALSEVDESRKGLTGYSILKDCLGFIINWSDCFDEALKYNDLLGQWTDASIAEAQLKQLTAFQQKGEQWWVVQQSMAYNFYNRNSPGEDAGKYASAQAILQTIIARALEEKPGYDIKEEYMYSILDDFVWLSLRSYGLVFEKFRTALAQGAPVANIDGAAEQYMIFEYPLKYWLELMPDMPPKWKPVFKEFYETLKRAPFPIFPDMMDKIGRYFPDATVETKACPYCGFQNSSVSPICVQCGISFESGKHFTKDKALKKSMKDAKKKGRSPFRR